VAISGNGGDELFAGYPWFIFMAQDEWRRRTQPLNAAARSLAASVAQHPFFDSLLASDSSGTIISRFRRLSGFTTRYGIQYQIFGPQGAARLLAPELRADAEMGRWLNRDLISIDELVGGTTIQRVSGLCLRGYNSNQLLRDTDAVSMIHSLEVRVPFLDPVVADVALALPDSAKLGDVSGKSGNGGSTYRSTGAKRILLDVGQELLPKDFDLQPKRGFAMPFEAWLTGPMRDVFLDAVSDKTVRARGLLNPRAAAEVRESVISGNFVWTQPWLLMMLELWCREVHDNAQAARRIAAEQPANSVSRSVA